MGGSAAAPLLQLPDNMLTLTADFSVSCVGPESNGGTRPNQYAQTSRSLNSSVRRRSHDQASPAVSRAALSLTVSGILKVPEFRRRETASGSTLRCLGMAMMSCGAFGAFIR